MDDAKRGGHSKYNGKSKLFGKHALSLLVHELRPVFNDARFFRIVWLGFINLSCLLILLNWCHSTKSLGLRSFTYIVFFDTLCLFICALRIWVEQKKPNTQYTFGYERFEVLAIFLSTTFSFVSALFLIKKSVERWIYPIPVPLGQFTSGILLAFFCHMVVTYCMKNKGLNLVVCASTTTMLQKRLTSLSQNFCTNVPGLSTKVSPRFNPFVLLGWGSFGILLSAQLLIDIYRYDGADCFGAICVSVMTCFVMYPLSAYSAKILLQGTPPHIADLIDKSLREASTLDGVLEFRNEHFWLLGYDKIFKTTDQQPQSAERRLTKGGGGVARKRYQNRQRQDQPAQVGSVHVRIRRDANEQVVLSHLMSKLSSLVPDITIQVFKDEWAWSSSTLQILNESFKKFPPSSSSIGLKASALAEKSTVSYSSVIPPNSYSKLLYSSSAPPSGNSETTSVYCRQSDTVPLSSAAVYSQRQSSKDVCSVNITNLGSTVSESTVAVRQSHLSNLPRSSRTEIEPLSAELGINIMSPDYPGSASSSAPYNSL